MMPTVLEGWDPGAHQAPVSPAGSPSSTPVQVGGRQVDGLGSLLRVGTGWTGEHAPGNRALPEARRCRPSALDDGGRDAVTGPAVEDDRRLVATGERDRDLGGRCRGPFAVPVGAGDGERARR